MSETREPDGTSAPQPGAPSAALTLERLFAEPPLAGTLPSRCRFTGDGTHLVLVRPDPEAREPESAVHVLRPADGVSWWLRAADLGAAAGLLTEAEKARRERLRIFRGGIVDVLAEPEGAALVVPVAGRLWRVPLPDGPTQALTPEDQAAVEPSCRPGGGVSWVHAGDLWYALPDRTPVRVTEDASDTVTNGLAEFLAQEEMHRYEGHWWSPCGGHLAWIRCDESPVPLTHRVDVQADRVTTVPQRYPFAGGPNARVTLHVLDLACGERAELPWDGGAPETWAYLARVRWTRDGSALLVQRQTRLQERLELVRLPRHGGPGQVLAQERAPTWINLGDDPGELPDGTLLWGTEADGTCRLVRLDTATGERTPITPAGAHVARLLDVSATHAWFLGWDRHPTERHLFRVPVQGTGDPERLTPAGGWHEVVLAPRAPGDDGAGGRAWLEIAATPEAPASLLLVRTDGGARQVQRLVDNRPRGDHPYAPFVGGHRPNVFGTLAAADGQTLHYRLTLPEAAPVNLPLVVHVYGGPGVQRVRREWQSPWPQFLARHGYAVLELDNRGSSGRGRAFEAPVHRRLGGPEVDDQVAGVRALVADGLVDPARVGVMGHSYGGYMTLRCLTRAPDVFRAGVAVAPVTDWALYDTHYTERYMGLPDEHGEAYAASGILEGLGNLADRVLIIHGMADDNVLFTHATQLFHRLQSARIPFEMMTYPGEKHGLATPSTALHRFRMSLRFLDRHLRG